MAKIPRTRFLHLLLVQKKTRRKLKLNSNQQLKELLMCVHTIGYRAQYSTEQPTSHTHTDTQRHT